MSTRECGGCLIYELYSELGKKKDRGLCRHESYLFGKKCQRHRSNHSWFDISIARAAVVIEVHFKWGVFHNENRQRTYRTTCEQHIKFSLSPHSMSRIEN